MSPWLIFETTEDIEIFKSFDEIGLREDLIKGTNNLIKVYMHTASINQALYNKEQ